MLTAHTWDYYLRALCDLNFNIGLHENKMANMQQEKYPISHTLLQVICKAVFGSLSQGSNQAMPPMSFTPPPWLNHGDIKWLSDRLKGVIFIHACVYPICFDLIEIKVLFPYNEFSYFVCKCKLPSLCPRQMCKLEN